MKVVRADVTREEVVRFYVAYDRGKKGQRAPSDLASWSGANPEQLDGKLREKGLKDGVLAAYKLWWFLELSLADLLDCAIVNHIFKGHPQSLSLLVLRGVVEKWEPSDRTEWYAPLERGDAFLPAWAMILRPSLKSELPAKWYIEDGSGRALCFVRRLLSHGESGRVAYGYLGVIPDEKSAFIRQRRELAG
jgi:hypothetical protein